MIRTHAETNTTGTIIYPPPVFYCNATAKCTNIALSVALPDVEMGDGHEDRTAAADIDLQLQSVGDARG